MHLFVRCTQLKCPTTNVITDLRNIFSVCPALGYVRISSFPIRRGHIQSNPLWLSVVIASVQLATPAATTTTPPLATVTTTWKWK